MSRRAIRNQTCAKIDYRITQKHKENIEVSLNEVPSSTKPKHKIFYERRNKNDSSPLKITNMWHINSQYIFFLYVRCNFIL
jgi:hypothetical protein